METAQNHARDFWLDLGAIVVFLADKRWDIVESVLHAHLC